MSLGGVSRATAKQQAVTNLLKIAAKREGSVPVEFSSYLKKPKKSMMIEGATERKWEYQNPTGSLNDKRFENISLPGIMTRRSDAGIVSFDKVSPREGKMSFAKQKSMIRDAKVTGYECNWDVSSTKEKITRDF